MNKKFAPGSAKHLDVVGQIPMGRMGGAREVVGAVLFLASDAATYCTGTDIVVDGGYTSQ
jgi:NAD(P)-dependent dehydrogenase (short-subunit alcohol dehydrogenase family)